MEIEKLEKKFEGSGEVKGYSFKRIKESDNGYIYQRFGNNGSISYEVFKKRAVAKCIDFKKRIYSETDFKEVYPKSKNFGDWAFNCMDLTSANIYLLGFNNEPKQ